MDQKIEILKTRSIYLAVMVALLALFSLPKSFAQITNTLFFDDFSAGLIDTNKYALDAPFFEGGLGDIAPTEANGVLEFTGTVNQQWWAGATLRLKQSFNVSEETNVVVSVDRLAEAGVGTSSRSALWIMDSTQARYVLFADNRGETHWEYNRKINEAGDAPTGSGTAISQFNTAANEDEGPHKMKAVVNGQNVKLYLDNIAGPTVKFPFTNVIFQVGSYARANSDTADTTFDNLKIESVGLATFGAKVLTAAAGQIVSNLTVKIPQGANATSAVQIRVTSGNPQVADSVGSTAGTLTLTFAAGATNIQTFNIKAVGLGGAQFTLASDIGLSAGNNLSVTVITGPGVLLQDDFSAAAINTNKWQLNPQSFEVGVGTFTETINKGALQISGTTDQTPYWAGASVKTVNGFTATKDLVLSVELDRVGIDPTSSDGATPSSGARTGVFLTTSDRSQFVFFAQDLGETGWEVNVNPGNPTGSGIAIPAFSSVNDTNKHHIKLVADGTKVEVFLDGQSGGKYDFPVTSDIYVELGAYARDVGDSVTGVFDNVSIQNILPCINTSLSDIAATTGSTNTVALTIPKLLTASGAVAVTVTSGNPNVAIPLGGSNGILTLNFPTGGTNVQAFGVRSVGVGTTTFTITTPAQGTCVANSINVTVTTAPSILLSDSFSTSAISTNWVLDQFPLVDTGVASVDSVVTITNGQAVIFVTADTASWPGLGLDTVQTFSANTTSPTSFEIDRVSLKYVLVTGTGAKEQTGIWAMDSSRSNYVFFSEYATHDGTAGGWEYFRNIGRNGDTPVSGTGVSIAAFAPSQFNDQGAHHMQIIVNGSTAKLYLDGVFGVEVPFPVTSGIVFGFGAYVLAATDVVTGVFDNAKITGSAPGLGALSAARQTSGDVLISWSGSGTLQSSATLGASPNWVDVTPAPLGTSFTITKASQIGTKFYRLRQ